MDRKTAQPAAPALPLRTPRLLLRRWRAGEGSVLRELWEERDVRVPPHRRISPEGRPTTGDLEEWIGEESLRPWPGLLALERRDTGELIGYCGLIQGGGAPGGAVEIAYEVLQRHQGEGFATEAGAAILEVARRLGHVQVSATIRDWNLPSRRVVEKLGFAEIGVIEADVEHGDTILTRIDL